MYNLDQRMLGPRTHTIFQLLQALEGYLELERIQEARWIVQHNLWEKRTTSSIQERNEDKDTNISWNKIRLDRRLG
jgi:hypothetical protein